MDDMIVNSNANTLWQRRESRVIRPFHDAGKYLCDSSIQLASEMEFTTNESLVLEEADVIDFSPSIRVPAPPNNLEETVGATLDQLTFVVVIEDGFLKRSRIIMSIPLRSISENSPIALPNIRDEPISWRSEIRIHLAVVLAESRKADLGFASRRGSWVAKKTFRIGRDKNMPQFRIQDVDEEWFQRRGLPRSTAYFLDVADTLDEPIEQLPDLVGIFVNRSLVHALARNESSSINQALMKTIYVDVVTSILSDGLTDLDGEPTPDGILDVVLNRLARTTKTTRQSLLQLAKEGRANEIRAWVQSAADFTHSMIVASRR